MSDFEAQVQAMLPRPSRIFTPVATTVCALMTFGWILVNYFPAFVRGQLLLGLTTLKAGKFWSLVSYVFASGCPWTVVLGVLLVLLVGSTIERKWGSKHLFFAFLCATLACGVIWILLSFVLLTLFRLQLPPVGTNMPITYAVIAIFGTLMARTRFLFFFVVLEARFIAWILIGLGLLLSIGQPLVWVFVLGAGVAWLYVRMQRRQTTGGMRVGRNIEHSETARGGGFVDLE